MIDNKSHLLIIVMSTGFVKNCVYIFASAACNFMPERNWSQVFYLNVFTIV